MVSDTKQALPSSISCCWVDKMVGIGAGCRAPWIECEPWNPHGRRRELTRWPYGSRRMESIMAATSGRHLGKHGSRSRKLVDHSFVYTQEPKRGQKRWGRSPRTSKSNPVTSNKALPPKGAINSPKYHTHCRESVQVHEYMGTLAIQTITGEKDPS